LTLAAFALHACSSGWKRNAFRAKSGRHTLTGTRKTKPAIFICGRMLANNSSASQSLFPQVRKVIFIGHVCQLQIVADLNEELGVFRQSIFAN
jgi:hypothetical protein